MDHIFQENTFFYMMAIGILVMLAFALSFVIFVNASQKRLMKEQMEKQKLAFQYQEELLHSTILTQEEERKRIARDLHDEIGSKLNVIFLNIHRLKEAQGEQKKVEEITEEVESVINTTIETTRRISHDLLPPTLEEFGLTEAIRELQFHFNRMENINIDFQLIDHTNQPRNKFEELNLFRVVQELINNSIRHGEANEISIALTLDQLSSMHYRDNGRGFDPAQTIHKKGLGMKNMESRLQMIHAEYNLETSPGNGLSIHLKWPTNNLSKLPKTKKI